MLPLRTRLALLTALAFSLGVLTGCGQEITSSSGSSLTDALYFADTATGLPLMYTGEDYTGNITVAGGTGPYTLRLVSGTLPPGIRLSGMRLLGKPTQGGTNKFSLEVTDSGLRSKVKEYVINVSDLPALSLNVQLPGGEIRGETRLPVTIAAPRTVRAARLVWELPEGAQVTRVQSAETGGVLIWRQDGQKLTLDVGFKTIPRSGARIALISLKPQKPLTLNLTSLGYEARDGAGKLLSEKKLPEPLKPAAPAAPEGQTAPVSISDAASATPQPAPELPTPTVTTSDTPPAAAPSDTTPPESKP